MKARIATRSSRLAILQTQWVKERLVRQCSDLKLDLLCLEDRERITKDSFVRACEEALLAGEARLAVHSAKDVPMRLPDGLKLRAFCNRVEARDALVTRAGSGWEELKKEAVIGTSSLRRKCELQRLRPSLRVVELRGNIETRLTSLDELDGIVLAAAAMQRLGLADRINHIFPVEDMLPAAGQGALAIEQCAADAEAERWLAGLNERETSLCVLAERSYCRHLGVDCNAPVGSYASLEDGRLQLRAMIGGEIRTERLTASLAVQLKAWETADSSSSDWQGQDYEERQAEDLGRKLAEEMLMNGAASFLNP